MDDRDEKTGRFLKGNKVENPNRGRPSRRDNIAFLIAVTEDAYTPEALRDMIRETYVQAKDKEDWRGMLEVIRLVMAYAVGKPVSKVLTAQVDADEIKEMFRELATGSRIDDAIDVTVVPDSEGAEVGHLPPDTEVRGTTEDGSMYRVSGDFGDSGEVS